MSNKQQGLIVAGIFLALAMLWFFKQDPQVNQLNAVLKADAAIASYPYPFHVLRVEEGTAIVSSPRSTQVSVLQFFQVALPNLDITNPDTPTVITAQKQLADVQGQVYNLIKAQPEIKDVLWEIDSAWYASHGVTLQ